MSCLHLTEDPRCERCDRRRVDTVRDGRPLCAPCATTELRELIAQADEHERAARYQAPATEPTEAEARELAAAVRRSIRSELARRPHPLPRGVTDAEARTTNPNRSTP